MLNDHETYDAIKVMRQQFPEASTTLVADCTFHFSTSHDPQCPIY